MSRHWSRSWSRSKPVHHRTSDRGQWGHGVNRQDHSKPVVLGSTEGGGIHGCERDRCWVVIPAYNEAATVREVALRSRQECAQVIVVDDGSTDNTAECLAGLDVIVLRNEDNAGKAESLWRGFQRALAHGAVAIITLDADGQHRPEEISRFVAAVQDNPETFFVGARERASEDIAWAVLGQLHGGFLDRLGGRRAD